MINSAEEFVRLRSSEIMEEYLRAAKEEAPISVWKEVIQKYPDYARWVVHNKIVPLEILTELYQSRPDVRCFIAMKRKLSPELFELLSNDENYIIRKEIAINQKTPLSILKKLASDKDNGVANTAKERIKEREERLAKAASRDGAKKP